MFFCFKLSLIPVAYCVMWYHPDLYDPNIGIRFANSSSNLAFAEKFEELTTLVVSVLTFDCIFKSFRFSMIRPSQDWLLFIAATIVFLKIESIFLLLLRLTSIGDRSLWCHFMLATVLVSILTSFITWYMWACYKLVNSPWVYTVLLYSTHFCLKVGSSPKLHEK